MSVHMEFDESWLKDYCARTGQPIPEGVNRPRDAKPAKYGNRRTEADGKTYASAKEARRHEELKLLQKAGKIVSFAEQVPFLLPGDIRYIADFVVLELDGQYRVEDAKGFRSKEYLLKRKLMKRSLGIEIIEV